MEKFRPCLGPLIRKDSGSGGLSPVNRRVVGSSPTWGAEKNPWSFNLRGFYFFSPGVHFLSKSVKTSIIGSGVGSGLFGEGLLPNLQEVVRADVNVPVPVEVVKIGRAHV